MGRENFKATLFGHETNINYSDKTIGYSILSLRLVMGWIFLQAGIQKLLDPEWAAEDFLTGAVAEANPFGFLWPLMTDLAVVDPLVMYGQIAIGLALLLGVFFRFTALMGGLQMILFWMASLEGGLLAGLPVGHGYVVDSTLVYALILFGLGALNAGRIYGVDQWLENTDLVKKYPKLRYVLG